MISPREIDHRTAIDALPAALRRRLTAQSDWPGLIRIIFHLGAVIATAVYVMLGLPAWPVALAAEAVLLTFLFAPLHECIHRTAFRSGRLNLFVAHTCGVLLLLPPSHFRYFHMAHHRFTHDPQLDPELTHPKPTTLGAHLFYLTGLPEWASRVTGLISQALPRVRPDYVPSRGHLRVAAEARIYLAGYGSLILASVSLGASLLLWIWVVPALLGQPLMRAYLLAEHTRCPHVSNMLENTRTTFTNRFVRWLAWNMPFHVEHHAYPAVPFHRLPDLHHELRDHLQSTATGYMRFNLDHAHLLAESHQPSAKVR